MSIRIYSAAGQLIRVLNLGYREAGLYVTKDKAAYWDGRNASGEQVSSGVYFCQLVTPTFQQIRRMVMLQ